MKVYHGLLMAGAVAAFRVLLRQRLSRIDRFDGGMTEEGLKGSYVTGPRHRALRLPEGKPELSRRSKHSADLRITTPRNRHPRGMAAWQLWQQTINDTPSLGGIPGHRLSRHSRPPRRRSVQCGCPGLPVPGITRRRQALNQWAGPPGHETIRSPGTRRLVAKELRGGGSGYGEVRSSVRRHAS